MARRPPAGAALALARTDRQPAADRPDDAAPGFTVRLVFVDSASGAIRSERSIRLSQLFVSQVLPFFDQYALSHRLWSRDSTAIALPLTDDPAEPQIVVLPADGSPAREIAPGTIAFWSP
jgi:TolB protein